jgi:heat shock protein HtpX
MGLMTILLVIIGKLIGGAVGMGFFLILSIVMNFVGYWTSGKVAIAMTRSYPVTEAELPEVYTIVRNLANRAGLPMPEIYVTPSDQPNAFATGRNPAHAKVAVTEGIIRALPARELEGVLAHEMAHVRNHDILIGSLAAMMAGVITWIANILQWGMIFGDRDREGNNGIGDLVAIILAPIAATVIQLAISRSREYKADAIGAKLVGDGNPLADALEHLESYSSRRPANVNPAAAHMFIVNPLRGHNLVQLFSTHPPTEERIRRLREMRIL